MEEIAMSLESATALLDGWVNVVKMVYYICECNQLFYESLLGTHAAECQPSCANGGHCIIPGHCSCPGNWTGARCEEGNR